MIDTYYYIGNEVDAIKCDTKFTEKEKQDGFKLMYCDVNEIEELLKNNKTNNPRNKYFYEEIMAVMKLYKDSIIEKNCDISLNKDYNVKKRIL